MRIIGLTGTIGSGKSTVSQLLRHMGAHIVCADALSRELQRPGAAGYAAIALAWPDCIGENGEIDRKKLGQVVFNDATQREKINAIMHPLIRQETLKRFCRIEQTAGPGAVVVLDAPLLIEANMQDLVQEIWLIAAEDDVLLQRICARDSLTEEQALSRMRAQMPLADKMRHARYVLENNGTLQEMQQKVEKLFYDTQPKNL